MNRDHPSRPLSQALSRIQVMTGRDPGEAHRTATPLELFFDLVFVIAFAQSSSEFAHTLAEGAYLHGWSWEVVTVGVAGVVLTFGLWWVYFMVPSGEMLAVHRNKGFAWGYSHILLFAAITATGAGLHVTAFFIDHESHIGILATVLTVAIPVAVFTGPLYALYTYMQNTLDRFHLLLMTLTAVVLMLAVVLAAAHVPVPICLMVLALAPAVSVAGFELVGFAHREQAIATQQELASAGHDHAG